MFCMKSESGKKKNLKAIRWQILSASFGISSCNDEQSKEINTSFFYHNPTCEIFYHFPRPFAGKTLVMTQVNVIFKSDWLIRIDFSEFKWNVVDDPSIEGHVRWVPWLYSDPLQIKKEEEEEGREGTSDEDSNFDEELGDLEDEEVKKLCEPKTEEEEEEEMSIEPGSRRYSNSGKFYKDLMTYFPHEKIIQKKNDIIAYGSQKLLDVVDKVINKLVQDDKKAHPQEYPVGNVTQITFKRKGHLEHDIDGLMIDGSPVRAYNENGDLQIIAKEAMTPMLYEIINNIAKSNHPVRNKPCKALHKNERRKEKEDQENKIFEKLFDNCAYLIKDLRKDFNTLPVDIQENEDNIVVKGTMYYIHKISERIHSLKSEYEKKQKEKSINVIEHKGFLANILAPFIENQRDRIKIENDKDDLKIECSKQDYKCIQNLITTLLKKYQNENQLMKIDQQLKELSHNLENEFTIHGCAESLQVLLVEFVTNYITQVKETVRFNTQNVEQISSFTFTINGPVLVFHVKSPNESQMKKIEGQFQEITKCLEYAKIVNGKMSKEINSVWKYISRFSLKSTGPKKILSEKFRKVLDEETRTFVEEFKDTVEDMLNKMIFAELKKKEINFFNFQQNCTNVIKKIEELNKEMVKHLDKIITKFINNMKEEALEANDIKEPLSTKALNLLIVDKIQEASLTIDTPEYLFDLLYRTELLVKAFKLNLPIYRYLPEFIDKFETNKLTMLKASTGSGKSTLIPVILHALGHKKIIVTQPRRLPCRMMSKRVNETFDRSVSGWAVSGEWKNPENSVIYMTDGLLKELILMKQDILPYDVIMLDEVHERGQNVDLCIALLSLRIQNKKEKFKLILCSATIDERILEKFKHIKSDIFEITIVNKKIVEKYDVQMQPVYLSVELAKMLKGDQQLLCFLPSTSEVKRALEVLREKFKKTAYPLLANQQNSLQEEYLRDGQIFFSTTIAETSLTFKNLVFVVDSGRIRAPLYNYKDKIDVLQELDSSKSTAMQRRGRLGRTKTTGYYYSSMPIDHIKVDYPVSELDKINLLDVYYNLLRCTKDNQKVKDILNAVPINTDVGKFNEKVALAEAELMKINIIDQSGNITIDGNSILSMPIACQAKMAKAIFKALTKYRCGQDLLLLSSIIIVLGSSYATVLKNISPAFLSLEGDYMTLLNLMYAILQKEQESLQKFKILQTLKDLNVKDSIVSLIANCYRKYKQIDQKFMKTHFKSVARLKGEWESIAKSLLEGFYDHAFVNGSFLGGPDLYYLRLDQDCEIRGRISQDSKLYKGPKVKKEEFIFAKDINFVQYGEYRQQTGILAFVGRLDKDWIETPIKRVFKYINEENVFKPHDLAATGYCKIVQNPNELVIEGAAGSVMENERRLKNLLLKTSQIVDLPAKIQSLNTTNQAMQSNYRENFNQILKDKGKIFKSLFWRWENLNQAKISFLKVGKIEVKNARVTLFQEIGNSIDKFVGWFKDCNCIRTEDSSVYPKMLDPTEKGYESIRQRIDRITNPNKDVFELLEYSIGPKASRVTRMELVCWILVNDFDCEVEGGFVRDWVVGGRENFPPGTKLQQDPNSNKKAILDESVCPKDLDIWMSSDIVFDMDKFIQKLAQFEITLTFDMSDGWRIYMIFDENAPTGAFTADLIEPFAQVCHDKIDMDVNNLYIKSGFTDGIGLKVSLDQLELHNGGGVIESISLEQIILNIQQKKFTILRTANLEQRRQKMIARGWTQNPKIYGLAPPSEIPRSFLDPVDEHNEIYQYVIDMMSPLGNITILRVFIIRNPAFDSIYEGMKNVIKHLNNNQANEQLLFHGTSQEGAEGIIQGNFDNRFYQAGRLGKGAYFATNPLKSKNYITPNNYGEKNIFICKVLLGKPQQVVQANQAITSPDRGYDSISACFDYPEYCVYRFGQAKPYLWIVYK